MQNGKGENVMKKIVSLALSFVIVLSAFVGLLSCGKGDPSDAATYAATSPETAVTTEEVLYEIPVVYKGHEILSGTYEVDGTVFPFKYSDGFFEVDPREYQTHMATTSTSLSHSATKEPRRGDYSVCYAETVSVLEQIGFGNIYVSDSYKVEPTVDSVACVIAEKTVECGRGTAKVIAIVLRSGSYFAEWASNFLLGTEGESAGIAAAADKVVENYLQDFLNDKAELRAAIEQGNAAFWVQGYSRGGGIANLAAKRLVDLYQRGGNDVYAYTVEGQMGGVREAQIPGSDYTVIHNVVNPADIVPYLAPASMGFKRYGLDHYLFSGNADTENPVRDETGEPVSDNKRLLTMGEKRIALVRKHLVWMLGDVPAVERYTPHAIAFRGINLFTKELTDLKTKSKTATFLERFVNAFTQTAEGEVVTDREAFVRSGLEAALGRMILFACSGSDLAGALDVELFGAIGSDVLEECKDALSQCAVWGGNGKMTVDLHGEIARTLTDSLIRRLLAAERLRTILSDYPEGGADRAFDDLSILVYRTLYAISDADYLVTFALNVVSLASNHEYISNLAILQSYDSWFEPTITD